MKKDKDNDDAISEHYQEMSDVLRDTPRRGESVRPGETVAEWMAGVKAELKAQAAAELERELADMRHQLDAQHRAQRSAAAMADAVRRHARADPTKDAFRPSARRAEIIEWARTAAIALGCITGLGVAIYALLAIVKAVAP